MNEKCQGCGGTEFKEKVVESIERIACEIEKVCVECHTIVDYWAYGNWESECDGPPAAQPVATCPEVCESCQHRTDFPEVDRLRFWRCKADGQTRRSVGAHGVIPLSCIRAVEHIVIGQNKGLANGMCE